MVYPCLVVNYLGQCALVMRDPSVIDSVFYNMIPTPVLWPMIVRALARLRL